MFHVDLCVFLRSGNEIICFFGLLDVSNSTIYFHLYLVSLITFMALFCGIYCTEYFVQSIEYEILNWIYFAWKYSSVALEFPYYS